MEKAVLLPPDVKWHFIGGLQSSEFEQSPCLFFDLMSL